MKTFILGFTLLASFISAKAQDECRYDVQLVSAGTNYEWIWKVTNPCPGNGKTDETLQDLSHWDLVPGCLTQADIVSVSYSMDMINWTSMSSTIAVDPSQSECPDPVLKFNKGLNGSIPVYFKLVVNKVFYMDLQWAVFKSGRYTGNYKIQIPGMVCPPGGDTGPR